MKEYTLKQLQEMTIDQFKVFVEQNITKTTKKNGIYLEFPYDLRASLEMKQKDCSVFHKWTAFLNNTGTLCHVVSAEAEILIRVTFTYPIKHLSAQKQLEAITGKIREWVVL